MGMPASCEWPRAKQFTQIISFTSSPCWGQVSYQHHPHFLRLRSNSSPTRTLTWVGVTAMPLGARSLLSSLSTQALCLPEPFHKHSTSQSLTNCPGCLEPFIRMKTITVTQGNQMPLCARSCPTGAISSLDLNSTEGKMPSLPASPMAEPRFRAAMSLGQGCWPRSSGVCSGSWCAHLPACLSVERPHAAKTRIHQQAPSP